MKIGRLKTKNTLYSKSGNLLFFLAVMVLLLLSGCTGNKKELDIVNVQLKWIHQGQFAGFYTAVEKGYYLEENIEVILHPGGPEINVIEEVENENSDFGVVGGEELIIGRSQSIPIKAIATTYRINPYVLVTMPDSGIEKPEDFVGKTADVYESGGYTQFYGMMTILNIDIGEINIIPYSNDIQAFYSGEIDITPAFAAGSLIGILEEEPEVNVIWPLDYGIQFYSDTIITKDSFIQNNPDLISRFLRATIKGHEYVLDHQEEAVQITLKYTQVQNEETQRQMIQASIPLIYTGKDKIGWMRQEKWQSMIDILDQQALLSNPVEVQTIFTNEFLEIIYEIQP